MPENDSTQDNAFEPSWKRLTDEQVKQLVGRILDRDDDDAAQALAALLYCIAHDQDFGSRDGLTSVAVDQAYTLTMTFDRATTDFLARSIQSIDEKGGRKR
jgi:hypothetical protein